MNYVFHSSVRPAFTSPNECQTFVFSAWIKCGKSSAVTSFVLALALPSKYSILLPRQLLAPSVCECVWTCSWMSIASNSHTPTHRRFTSNGDDSYFPCCVSWKIDYNNIFARRMVRLLANTVETRSACCALLLYTKIQNSSSFWNRNVMYYVPTHEFHTRKHAYSL